MTAEGHFRGLFHNHMDGILVLDTSGNSLYGNPAACRLFGTDRLEGNLLGLPILAGKTAEIEVLREGHPLVVELRMMTTRWNADEATVAFLRDVTAQRSLERMLYQRQQADAEQAQLLQSIFDALPVQVALLDSTGRVLAVNANWEKAVAAADGPAVRVGDDYLAHLASLQGDVVVVPLRELLQGTRRHFEQEIFAQGWWLVIGSAFRHGETNGAVVVHQDVSARKTAEESVRSSELRLQSALEASEAVTFELDDASLDMVWSGPTAEFFQGQPPCRTLADFLSWVHADDRSQLQAVLKGREGQVFQLRFRVPSVNPQRPRWVRGRGRYLSSQGRYLAILGDRTQYEELEAQIFQLQKMEALGRMTACLAHDFNNLFCALFGQLCLLEEDLEKRGWPVGRSEVGEMKHIADKLQGLTRQLSTFSRQKTVAPQIVCVSQLVGSMERILRRLLGQHIELKLELAFDLWPVLADPTRLEQALVNLIVNARDAMPAGGRVWLRSLNVESGSPAAPALLNPTQDYVLLAVTDTGCGMEPEILGRLFEPFFTTKAPGRGTGLGLSTTYGVVTQAGGHLTVESQLGSGSTFRMYFPRHRCMLGSI